MKLLDKVAIVSGGSSGISRAIAIEYAREGANVAAIGRNEKRLTEVEEAISAAGGKCMGIKADLIIQSNIEKPRAEHEVVTFRRRLVQDVSLLEGRVRMPETRCFDHRH